jgi:CheY-like chemotaxis protein
VVVLDLAMPDLDGLETATFMTACDPAVPIVLFTILGVEGIEGQAKAAGIRAIVPKTEAWSLIPLAVAHQNLWAWGLRLIRSLLLIDVRGFAQLLIW